jgi:serine protease AprX
VPEVNAGSAVTANTPGVTPGPGGKQIVVNAGLTPNSLVDTASGDIDYSRSSWSRSSWSTAPDSLTAGFARSSWSCACATSASTDSIDPTRSSWSRSSWSTKWSY